MRTERQAYLDTLILRSLASVGSYPMPEGALRDHLALRVVPPARAAEVDDSLRYLESQRRIGAIEGETGLLWRLTDTGRSWWTEHRF